MLFALLLGAILGFTSLEVPFAIVILTAALALKAMVDVRFEKIPLIGMPSPFLIYCRNLAAQGEETGHAWFSYAVQLMVFGIVFGGGLFAFARYLRS